MPRVLVVEDYPPLATVLAIGVGRLGHEVVRVGSAQRVRALPDNWDCAIIDIDLPDGCGVELAQELLDNQRVSGVVFYTATRDQARRASALELGSVVDKAEPLQALLDVMAAWFAEHPKRALAVGDSGADGGPTGRSGTRPRVR